MRWIFIVFYIFFWSCNSQKKWHLKTSLTLQNVKPIGITSLNNEIWISDGDHNRLVKIDSKGNIKKEVSELERPMHIASYDNKIWIPEYGNDTIRKYVYGTLSTLEKAPKLDAPAGVWATKNNIAIADFYGHKVHYFNGEKWISIGEKGHYEGQLHYPTDVQIVDNLIYVADAYNHRIQIFDHNGIFIKQMAQDFNINAATGIFVTKNQIFVTDFENNRVLVLSKEGELLQELKEGLQNPTDVLVMKNELFVVNYKSGTLSVFNAP